MSKPTQVLAIIFIIITFVITAYWIHYQNKTQKNWSTTELRILQSLWIGNLSPLARSVSNKVADNLLAAQLGHKLFFDPRLSATGNISCATCHIPELSFTDGLKVAQGNKQGVRNTMGLIGVAYSPWFFWDGRKDSLWSQALAPLENSLEQAGTRTFFAHLIYEVSDYKSIYEELFGAFPDLSDKSRFPIHAGPVENKDWNQAWKEMSVNDKKEINNIFVNIGKSIAAYERLLLPGPSRFDTYVEGVMENNKEKMKSLNLKEINGLKLFIGKAQCTNCHNSPLFTNNEFHNTSILSPPGQLPSIGRAQGARKVVTDNFNCLGLYSDANIQDCADLRFIKTGDDLIGAHKTPSLRNVAETAPYMHAGQLNNLFEVIDQYNLAPPAMIGHNEAKPLSLNIIEIQQLEAFLHTLSSPLSTDLKWLTIPTY